MIGAHFASVPFASKQTTPADTTVDAGRPGTVTGPAPSMINGVVVPVESLTTTLPPGGALISTSAACALTVNATNIASAAARSGEKPTIDFMMELILTVKREAGGATERSDPEKKQAEADHAEHESTGCRHGEARLGQAKPADGDAGRVAIAQ